MLDTCRSADKCSACVGDVRGHSFPLTSLPFSYTRLRLCSTSPSSRSHSFWFFFGCSFRAFGGDGVGGGGGRFAHFLLPSVALIGQRFNMGWGGGHRRSTIQYERERERERERGAADRHRLFYLYTSIFMLICVTVLFDVEIERPKRQISFYAFIMNTTVL